jgi:hypothetical protein
MGKNSNDPDRYYRTGVAIQMEQKPEYLARMEKLGLKTAGELVNFFVNAEGMVEALLPMIAPWRKARKLAGPSVAAVRRKEAMSAIKNLSPDELAELISAAQKAAGAKTS